MQLYPAIDIKGGQCVRLTQGLFDNVKVYSDTPADMARMWSRKAIPRRTDSAGWRCILEKKKISPIQWHLATA